LHPILNFAAKVYPYIFVPITGVPIKPATNMFTPSAQCYPRHACPLYASLFMHMHVLPFNAPALASHTLSDPIWIMLIHASICTLMQKQKAT